MYIGSLEKEKICFQSFTTFFLSYVFPKLFVVRMKNCASLYVPNKTPPWSSFPVLAYINDGDGIINVAVIEEQQAQERSG